MKDSKVISMKNQKFSTGKGDYARVGYMNIKWYDKNKSDDDLKDAWDGYDSQ